jgi:hypothetical protein
VPPLRSLTGGGSSLTFQTRLVPRHALVNFLDCALAAVAVLFLKQADEDVELAGGPIQIVIAEFASPRFGLASDLFPLAFEYILVHSLILLIL